MDNKPIEIAGKTAITGGSSLIGGGVGAAIGTLLLPGIGTAVGYLLGVGTGAASGYQASKKWFE
ncbi:hypothetical protein [Paenibacillus sp. HB172176]|uniref:hypothetical protein n=1 Tax=Paenibacillus sp. HB172176 TaxID=2493690 RepID=UPI001439D439|nr:hypothetical protein [Paenibacillus sp. HB172176]